tara:strand:+ start:4216 stop:4584 length:369 start_codon:yes stop_codon:yes gene_type:complete
MNSKDKGKRGERMWVKVLQFFGYTAKRTGFHQSQQGHDAPDVTCHDLPVHWEVKNTEKALIRDWLAQSEGDAKDYEIPCVVWKKNHGKWIAILQAEHLLTIFQCCDIKALEEQIQQTNNKSI